MRELFLMSAEELDRVAVLQRVVERRLTRRKAAELSQGERQWNTRTNKSRHAPITAT